jgi:DNA-binding NarL/FixJ family response regulator
MNALRLLQSCFATVSDYGGCDVIAPLAKIQVMGANRLVNQSLVLMLEKAFDVCCTADDELSLEMFDDLGTGRPPILLIDCLSWDVDTIVDKIVDPIRHLPVESTVVLFNADTNNGHIEKLDPTIVRGIFFHDDSKAVFLEGMDAVMKGRRWLVRDDEKRNMPLASKRSATSLSKSQMLSKREIEILDCIANGMSNADIADALDISPHTVKTHIYNIFKKIEVPNRLQAALWYTSNI